MLDLKLTNFVFLIFHPLSQEGIVVYFVDPEIVDLMKMQKDDLCLVEDSPQVKSPVVM